jgi:uridine kinase
MFILGIAGGTASGKSTLAHLLSERLGERALTIHHDRYYRDIPEPRGYNYDHPDALDTALLIRNLDALREGREAPLPVYDFRSHRRLPEPEPVGPRAVVIVEGILALAVPELRSRMDFKVFVHAAADLRLTRRIRRDTVERGRDVAGVLDQYLATVRPMHDRFVEPSRLFADMDLSGEANLGHSLDRLVGALQVVGVL